MLIKQNVNNGVRKDSPLAKQNISFDKGGLMFLIWYVKETKNVKHRNLAYSRNVDRKSESESEADFVLTWFDTIFGNEWYDLSKMFSVPEKCAVLRDSANPEDSACG